MVTAVNHQVLFVAGNRYVIIAREDGGVDVVEDPK